MGAGDANGAAAAPLTATAQRSEEAIVMENARTLPSFTASPHATRRNQTQQKKRALVAAGARRRAAKPTRVKATLFADGGSRGNPGPAASGAVLFAEDGTALAEIGEYLGIATNNVAEWRALLAGLTKARDLGIDELDVRLDSELVVRQLTGVYRVKHADLIPLFTKAKSLLRAFRAVDIRHVRRKDNAAADAVVNQVLDEAAARARAGMGD